MAIGALVVLNAVLIFMLLRPPEPPASDPLPDFTPEPATTSASAGTKVPPGGTTSPEPAPDATTGAPAQVGAQPAQRLLAASTEAVAWRASTGDCEAPAVLEYTEDGGATWSAREPGVTPVSRMKVQSGSAMFVIGGTDGCSPTYRSTSNAGVTWSTADEYLGGSWFLLPADRTRMSAPAGEVPVPCEGEPVGLAGLDAERAAVLCTEGTLQLTSDGGSTWAAAGSTPGALALGLRPDGYVLATASPDCAGVEVRLPDAAGAGLDDAAGCAPAAQAEPGQVAVSATWDTVWLWSGDEVLVSADAGQTW
ncbi:hypothetical protein [Georgenia wangjunii]|uniref:hypothetical protein n=1 Tax=Georgenia wangjunii TaxID=3117730 RepID=UPI002F26A820